MSRKGTGTAPQAHRIVMEAEVARQVRQHAKTSMNAEVCGVLIGREEGPTTVVEGCIAGANAAQGGAHVTFTQETWEHIYQVKDSKYPNDRIVGWYHSHPGFGVFLSDHDLFIHKNFFSSPQQIAWVYDPHSDEEGCFGWQKGKIDKLDDVAFRYGQPCGGMAATDAGTELEFAVTVNGGWASEWKPLLRQFVIGLCLCFIGAVTAYVLIARNALLFPRGTHALVIVNGDEIAVVPPKLAEEFMDMIEREMGPQGMQKLPGAAKPQPGGAAKDQQGGRDGRQK